MIFHENRLLADVSHEISHLIFSKIRKMSQNLLSAEVVIDALSQKHEILPSMQRVMVIVSFDRLATTCPKLMLSAVTMRS